MYLSRPVFVARVHLDALTERDTDGAVADRLLAALPGLAQHHCAAGAPGGFVARLREGTGGVIEVNAAPRPADAPAPGERPGPFRGGVHRGRSVSIR